MTLLKLLSSRNYLIINKDLMRILGIDESILLGELAGEYDSWLKKGMLKNGYFYSTIDNVEKNTTLSKYKQNQALNKLKTLGIVETKLQGIPAKRYIKINEERIEQVIEDEMTKNFLHSCQKINQLCGEEFTTNNNNINNNNSNNYYSNLNNSNTIIYNSNYSIKEKEINKEKEIDPFAEYYE